MNPCMIRTLILILSLPLFTALNAAQIEFQYKSDYLSGYKKEISGQTINYYTIGGQSIDALLVRSLDSREFIEWETEEIPNDNKNEIVNFAMMASLQVTKETHRFDIYLNNTKYFSLNNPVEKSLNAIKLKGLNGAELEFSSLEYDRFEDLTGMLLLHLPAKYFPAGKPVTIRIVGESAKSRTWFMVFKHNCKSIVTLSSENIILNNPGTPKQSMRVKIFHMTAPSNASIKIGDTETKFDVKFGYNYLIAGLEKLSEPKELPVEFKLDNKTIGATTYLFKPVTPVTIYLLPHSHVDIGYTHVQEEVERLQWHHMEEAIELGNKTINYPAGSKFKWNTEVMWAVDSYLASASPEKKSRFTDAVQKGIIGIDGVYGNMMTALLSPEEWIRMADYIKKINDICYIKIESAMICDVPGWTWSMVPMLANSGVKYLSFGINQGDRIGNVRRDLGDKPFYWVSPSGKEKVLTWVHEQGYSAFHYVPKSGSEVGYSLIEPTLVNYANKLADDKCPYDIIPLHYTIGSDNGPTDKHLADNIKKWNDAYLSPKVVIATTAEFFREFEKKYGSSLPEMKGDITPYWEDGAASSAKETALNRQSADKLSLASTITAQYIPEKYNNHLFAKAWQNVLLYDEHTWGSWNSVSEPDIDFTLQQWKVKQSFALEGAKQADSLLKLAVNSLSSNTEPGNAVEVFNTSSVRRTDIAVLPDKIANQLKNGISLTDDKGAAVPVQKLTNGSSVFLASEVPAMGSKRYFIGKAANTISLKPVTVSNSTLENEHLKIELDAEKGIINKITLKDSGTNLVNNSERFGMGAYIYVNGRKPDSPLGHTNAEIRIKENGPIVSSLQLKLNGPGCNSIEQEIKLVSGINRVELNYTFDKQKIYTPEAVRIAFPFNIPGSELRIQNAYGFYQTEKEQIKGSNKNFFTLNNCVDLSNNEHGVTIVSPDAPLVEIGGLTNDALPLGWRETCMEGTSLYSYLMNNYWHTNYCATQEGVSGYRYILYPHKKFNPAVSETMGLISEQPLIALAINKEAKSIEPALRFDNENVFLVSLQPVGNGKAVWGVFYNASESETNLNLLFSAKPSVIYESDLLKNKKNKISTSFSIPAKGLKFLFIEL